VPIDLASCPACSADASESDIYRRETAFDPTYPNFGVAQNNCMLHDALRVDRVTRSLKRCDHCGLHFISPGFTAEELTRLYNSRMRDHYALVKGNEPSPAAHIGDPRPIWDAEARHSRFIFDRLAALWLRSFEHRVVADVGGQYGYHLRHFLKAGACGYVKDLVEQERLFPGVEWRRTLAEIGSIDVVLCTHVLEHVVMLAEFIREIGAAQPNDGICYVEVPYELDSRLRNRDFGVPFHVNFFSLASLANVMRVGGYEAQRTWMARLTYGGQPMLVICGTFRRGLAGRRRRVAGRYSEILRGGLFRAVNTWTPALITFRA